MFVSLWVMSLLLKVVVCIPVSFAALVSPHPCVPGRLNFSLSVPASLVDTNWCIGGLVLKLLRVRVALKV